MMFRKPARIVTELMMIIVLVSVTWIASVLMSIEMAVAAAVREVFLETVAVRACRRPAGIAGKARMTNAARGLMTGASQCQLLLLSQQVLHLRQSHWMHW
jgi:hypothetical protein